MHLATLDLRYNARVNDKFLTYLVAELYTDAKLAAHPLRELRLEGTGVTDNGVFAVAMLYLERGVESFPHFQLLALPTHISPGARQHLAAATAGGVLKVVYG